MESKAKKAYDFMGESIKKLNELKLTMYTDQERFNLWVRAFMIEGLSKDDAIVKANEVMYDYEDIMEYRREDEGFTCSVWGR